MLPSSFEDSLSCPRTEPAAVGCGVALPARGRCLVRVHTCISVAGSLRSFGLGLAAKRSGVGEGAVSGVGGRGEWDEPLVGGCRGGEICRRSGVVRLPSCWRLGGVRFVSGSVLPGIVSKSGHASFGRRLRFFSNSKFVGLASSFFVFVLPHACLIFCSWCSFWLALFWFGWAIVFLMWLLACLSGFLLAMLFLVLNLCGFRRCFFRSYLFCLQYSCVF